jgi:hypothetical protein
VAIWSALPSARFFQRMLLRTTASLESATKSAPPLPAVRLEAKVALTKRAAAPSVT